MTHKLLEYILERFPYAKVSEIARHYNDEWLFQDGVKRIPNEDDIKEILKLILLEKFEDKHGDGKDRLEVIVGPYSVNVRYRARKKVGKRGYLAWRGHGGRSWFLCPDKIRIIIKYDENDI